MLGKGGKGKKGKGDKKGKGKGKKGERNKDDKDKDKDKKGKGKGKGKSSAKAEYFAGYCLHCNGWGHMEKDCWWNENAKSGKDTASVETPITPAESTKTEPPITGMLIKDFLIDSGAATSVCQQSLADSLGGKPRGPGVEFRSAGGHQCTTTGNTTICLRTRDGVNVASDFRIAPKNTGLPRSIGGTSVRQRQYHHVPQERSSMSSLEIELSSNVLVVCIG